MGKDENMERRSKDAARYIGRKTKLNQERSDNIATSLSVGNSALGYSTARKISSKPLARR